MMKWEGFGRKWSQPTRDKTLLFACVLGWRWGVGGVGGEKYNQKDRIGGAAAKIRTGSQLQVPSLTT
jgi:hypothetical protein